jgi:acetyl esterase/lipase
VQVVRDLIYRELHEGEDGSKGKNKLDLFRPKGRNDFPVVFFVHGGAWRRGDKNYLGVYSSLGMCLARLGIGTVVTNYRLSPGVRHPEHVKDVARAFGWTCRNIQKYGGSPEQLFVCGHSAGGHLVSLLTTNEDYLKAEGLSRTAIKGAIPISGVYDVATAELGLFQTVFGRDPTVRKEASPVTHVGPGLPPFLIVYADNDFRTCDEMSEKFCRALKEQQCQARTLEVKDRNHITVLLNASRSEDPVPQAIREFVAGHLAEPGGTSKAPRGDRKP